MRISSQKARGRRNLRFQNFDEMLQDARQLAGSANTKMLGNWSLSQIFEHLSIALVGSIDGVPSIARFPIRIVAPLMVNYFIRHGMPTGFKLRKEVESRVFPDGKKLEDSLDRLHAAVARVNSESMNQRHPVFGKLSQEQWRQIHLRHAELHLSFATIVHQSNA